MRASKESITIIKPRENKRGHESFGGLKERYCRPPMRSPYSDAISQTTGRSKIKNNVRQLKRKEKKKHFLFQNPECGAFLFRNTFYNLHIAAQSLPPSVDPSGYALKHQLPMLTHVIRERKMWPPGLRSKPAVDPRKVETGSVHVIQKLREGKWFVSWRYF